MASQETPQVTEKTVQNTAVPVVAMPVPAHSLPQELVATGYQPYYQPYPGQQPVSQPPVESRMDGFTRLGFHGAGVLLGAIGLGLSLGSLQGGNISGAIAAAPPAGIAMVWSLAEVITRAVRKFKSGIHPGAHVGVCLILWMLSSVMGGILCTYVALNPYRDDQDCGTYTYTDSYGNRHTSSSYCDEYSDPYPRGKLLGAAVITCLIFGLYFGLFIDACINTHRRNVAAKRPIMMIAQPQNWPAAAQGWQPMQNVASTEAVQMQTPAAAATQAPVIREYYAPA
ncbi:uncharacterized protein TRIVIDRAFT_215551 [Trichoderma virens Gv29-8]|uniref:Uncharacterized protein n=1 Tax=Hypocrea virens (strain Gv29-8 / FGSC 10586) TaxID=413071 RepID=G9MLN6_HYPVG|nr:uncharacterized protein TRIVIDRAFT_215551 [Trichoderma virens Gv29-8]EHK24263.1 hypothetical protein TRIVIDRAFT_215551 [Trichoderma virens Gv29-8]UKZ54528.1 hypothetical protein TrVGV298_008337 [Trichoderma virens]